MNLLQRIEQRAAELRVPLRAHLDITYRCNEYCAHCYVHRRDVDEMSLAEIRDLLQQLAEAGGLFLLISGGEPLSRPDCFEILHYARSLLFNVRLKTNAVLIGDAESRRLRALAIEQVHVSIYSHRDAAHDAVTRLPGSLQRTLAGIRSLRSQGVKVTVVNVLMRQTFSDQEGAQALARDLDAQYAVDPTVTPGLSGDPAPLRHRIGLDQLRAVFRQSAIVGRVEEFCASPAPMDHRTLDGVPCGAGHSTCYISPCGDVYPCVQFPLWAGNARQRRFMEIWKDSPQFSEVRSVRTRDLEPCASCVHGAVCSRCPGLAYMEGNMRGPSSADCERSLARTGIPASTGAPSVLASAPAELPE